MAWTAAVSEPFPLHAPPVSRPSEAAIRKTRYCVAASFDGQRSSRTWAAATLPALILTRAAFLTMSCLRNRCPAHLRHREKFSFPHGSKAL